MIREFHLNKAGFFPKVISSITKATHSIPFIAMELLGISGMLYLYKEWEWLFASFLYKSSCISSILLCKISSVSLLKEGLMIAKGCYLFTDLSASPTALASSEMTSPVTFGASFSGTEGKVHGPGPGLFLVKCKESNRWSEGHFHPCPIEKAP